MSREEYLAARRSRDPDYDTNCALARALFALAAAFHHRREALGYRLEEVAQETASPVERLEMVEEGDVSSLPEIMKIAQILRLSLRFDGFSAVHAVPIDDLSATPIAAREPSDAATAAVGHP